MSGILNKAANIVAPYGDGTANTNVRYFTCDSTSRCDALPDTWAGKFVMLTNEGSVNVRWFTSRLSTASCDETLTAQDAGRASASLGGVIPAGQSVHRRLPTLSKGEHLYLVRAATASCPLTLELTSD
jgi:hypothetical protein